MCMYDDDDSTFLYIIIAIEQIQLVHTWPSWSQLASAHTDKRVDNIRGTIEVITSGKHINITNHKSEQRQSQFHGFMHATASPLNV